MPVVQPYRKTASRRVTTNLQNVHFHAPSAADPVDKRRQLQAFPPNFIHSLDATHMLLSALKCTEEGLTFAAVHDSFWTHAADVPTMNGILRDSFIRMHSESVISRLAAEFRARYKGAMYLAQIKALSPLGKKIGQWRRENARSTEKSQSRLQHVGELLLERKRLKLLASENPEDKKKGEKMVTPVSIFDQTANETDFAIEDDLEETTIGSMASASRITKLQANEQIEVGDADNVGDVANAFTGNVAPFDISHQEVNPAKEVEEEVETSSKTTTDANTNAETKADRKQRRADKAKKERTVKVWLPISFPPIPKKVCH